MRCLPDTIPGGNDRINLTLIDGVLTQHIPATEHQECLGEVERLKPALGSHKGNRKAF